MAYKIIILILLTLNLYSQENKFLRYTEPSFNWTDSIIQNMSLDEKIGQLFMVAAYSNKGNKHKKKIDSLINNYNIGGIIFFQGSSHKQATLTNHYQKISKTPLFVAIDGEWGLAMRLDSTFAYPWAMTLAAVDNDSLIYQMGTQIAKHCKLLGININFAPVADINNNPKNPIIGNRALGSDKLNVTKKSILYMRALQDNQVMACAKHFPGHGNTSKDSHKELPIIKGSKDSLQKLEIYPFSELINYGIGSVMIGHLLMPSFDKQLPSSLSPKIINNFLRNEMLFSGLVFTDALNMKALDKYDNGDLELKAFLAGNDILLLPRNIKNAIKKIKDHLQKGKISMNYLNYRIKKILLTKYHLGLNKNNIIKKDSLIQKLNSKKDTALKYKIMQNAITLLKNEDSTLPIKDINSKIALVKIGAQQTDETFVKYINKYIKINQINISKNNLYKQIKKLKTYDKVIISIHKSNANPWKNHKLKIFEKTLISKISENTNVILVLFANPYSLMDLNLSNVKSIIMAYQNNKYAQMIVPQIIFGAQNPKGKLPININKELLFGKGINIKNISRLGFDFPYNKGFDPKKIKTIDSLINISISDSVFPGCQILVAKDAKVVYQKSYGHHTYKKKIKVNNSHIYDLASITKIASSTAIIMKMVEDGKLNLFKNLSDIFPKLKGTNKDTINIKEALSHNAKLIPWIPFYSKTIKDKYKKGYYSKVKKDNYKLKVSKNLFIHNKFKDSIINAITESKLIEKKKYLYSGLIFYLMKYYIEDTYKTDIGTLSDSLFYNPLGAITTTYNPLKKFPKKIIVPTENDTIFRKSLLRGYVHDPGAAMQGGLGANAGLFSNSYDLAKVMQMFLQRGYYGGTRFINKHVFDEFNTCHYCYDGNRRGLGFDKPQLKDEGPTFLEISKKSFGHMGYTGTMAWADPEKKIIFIFLSNRVYPTAKNTKIIDRNIRTNLLELVYKAMY